MNQENLIEKYFENTLTEAEREHFEDLLQNDTEFASEISFQESLKIALIKNEREALKKTLQSFEQPKRKEKFKYKWFAAASIILLLGMGTWFGMQNNDPVQLYQEFYQTYPNVVAPTVRSEVELDEKASAFYEYDNKNYRLSFDLFSKLYKEGKDDYALFYASLSLMELQKYDEAIKMFNLFDLNKNNPFTPYIKWYKALCLLKLNKVAEAKLLIDDLAKTQNPQQEKAKQLDNKLPKKF
jgi:hypothetical protein